jgi:mono/diheme cytochrome c family protein
MGKYALLLAAAVLFVLLPASVAGGVAQDAGAKAPTKANPEVMAKAKKLYAVDCAMCHGDNGNGKTDLAKDMELTQRDWTDPKALAGMSDKELFDIIRKGKGKMPAEEVGRAKDDEVWHMILYIRGMAQAQPVAPAPAN